MLQRSTGADGWVEALQSENEALQAQIQLQNQLLEARELINSQGEAIEHQARIAAKQAVADG